MRLAQSKTLKYSPLPSFPGLPASSFRSLAVCKNGVQGIKKLMAGRLGMRLLSLSDPIPGFSHRYEKLAEQEELGYQQQRRRLYAEVQQEKDRLAEQSHQQQAALEQTLREMRESAEREAEELKNEHTRYVTAI